MGKNENEYLETDVDKLYEMVKRNGVIKVTEAAKKLKVKVEQIEEWGRVLEEHDLALLHYPPFGDPVLILRKFKPTKIKAKRKIRKKPLIVNLAIILAFVFFLLVYTRRLDVGSIPDVSQIPSVLAQGQIYLTSLLIIIIALLLITTIRKALRKRGGEKHEKRKGKNRKL